MDVLLPNGHTIRDRVFPSITTRQDASSHPSRAIRTNDSRKQETHRIPCLFFKINTKIRNDNSRNSSVDSTINSGSSIISMPLVFRIVIVVVDASKLVDPIVVPAIASYDPALFPPTETDRPSACMRRGC